MRHAVLVVAAALLGAGGAAARRADTDFEFDDDAAQQLAAGPRRARRYVYDPHNPLCASLSCGGRTSCLLRDAFTALCADRQELLRRGDVIVAGGSGAWGGGGGGGGEEEDEVFYEPDTKPDAPAKPDRCVGCGAAGAGGGGGGTDGAADGSFVCGSDNRTYSSLCRLDLHNCVRRPRPPVAPACPGFCPCAPSPAAAPAAAPAARARRPRARRPRARLHQYDEEPVTDAPAPAPAFPKEWWRRQAEAAHNEALPDRELKRDRVRARNHERERDDHKRRRLNKEGAGAGGCSAARLAERLVDWFSVVQERAGAGAARPVPARGWPAGCKPEVRWMFRHLDADRDGRLGDRDLYALRHDDREQCLRPFLASCAGAGSGSGAGVTRAQWCACLGRAARPCAALARAHAGTQSAGGYVPACDAAGYYRARQCHPALGVCWCVSPHGVERAGTRTRGAPHCPENHTVPAAAEEQEQEQEQEQEEEQVGAPDDDEDAAGSGDNELRF